MTVTEYTPEMIKRFYEASRRPATDSEDRPECVKAAEEDMQAAKYLNYQRHAVRPAAPLTTNKYKKNNYASFPNTRFEEPGSSQQSWPALPSSTSSSVTAQTCHFLLPRN
ncbi:MAG: hypothetical protein ACLRW2_12930 [Parasutterella excrementihominis]